MSLTLSDTEGLLWEVEVVRRWQTNNGLGALVNKGWKDQEERRPASLADLVEVLRAEGYVVRPPHSKSEAKRIAIQQGSPLDRYNDGTRTTGTRTTEEQ